MKTKMKTKMKMKMKTKTKTKNDVDVTNWQPCHLWRGKNLMSHYCQAAGNKKLKKIYPLC